MGLAEDIKQTKFISERQKGLLNLIYTYNTVINEMNDYFKEHDITRQQYNVLRILRGQYPKPASINLLKERMLDKMSDTSRIVKRLEKKKLVKREESDADRRAVEITITKSGLKLLEDTDNTVSGFSHLLDNLTDKEAVQLNTLLDKIRG
ncbi:MarR family winged helix-turn-helix transcriptional regulator [Fulvivirga sedimenti]|uniref:MarR family transcriptional regulator n=1 Tax=Fulvivirga sedimenti TaxID=2879465 RepID=A0A9X1HJX9_9BACT|nr:MarR family transcriptional regulator [Fulvivirga sedimenti]MCA6073539.1 MarR family transcriptional regulator [Fulvivirga sedimenti]